MEAPLLVVVGGGTPVVIVEGLAGKKKSVTIKVATLRKNATLLAM
jgi:hypothetical protein